MRGGIGSETPVNDSDLGLTEKKAVEAEGKEAVHHGAAEGAPETSHMKPRDQR